MGRTVGQSTIERDLEIWQRKPLLWEVYRGLWGRLVSLVDRGRPGPCVEIGAGIGKMRGLLPQAILTDVQRHPRLDLVCDGYRLPFRDDSISHLLMTDVFHHLEAPYAFLAEAYRVLCARGRLLLLEPYIGGVGGVVYGLFHPEPIAWRAAISTGPMPPERRRAYAAQGNATRIFFRPGASEPLRRRGWNIMHREAFACFSYLLSGGFSWPAFYPASCLPWLTRLDVWLSRWPRLFGARCVVGLEKSGRQARKTWEGERPREPIF